MASDIVPIQLSLTEGDLVTLWAPKWREDGEEWEAFLGDDDALFAFPEVAQLAAFVRTAREHDLVDHPAWSVVPDLSVAELTPQETQTYDVIGVPELVAEDADQWTIGELGEIVEMLRSAFFEAHDTGLNTHFWEPRYAAQTQFLKSSRTLRDNLVIVAGSYHSGPAALRRDVESALRRLRTSWLDVFLLFWVRAPERLSDEDFTALDHLRAQGKVRAFGFSTHLRELARSALARHPWPVVMTRHSAAHPGAESTFLPEAHARGTGVLTFTATCYGRLLQPSPGAPPDAPVPSAVDCYRYSLAQPGVSATLTAPRSRRELLHNLDVLSRPTLEPDALPAMRAHGERVRARSRQLDALVRRAPGGPRDALLALLEEDGPPGAGDLPSL